MAMCVMAVVGAGPVPVLFARREPHHVAGPDFLDRPALPLHPAAAAGHDQRLAQRVGVPRGACTRLERDAGPADAGRVGASNSGSIRTVPVNQSAGPFAEACEPTRLMSMCCSLLGPVMGVPVRTRPPRPSPLVLTSDPRLPRFLRMTETLGGWQETGMDEPPRYLDDPLKSHQKRRGRQMR